MIVFPRCSFHLPIEACETESRRASCLVFYELLEMTSKTGRRRLRRVKICSHLWTSILCFARGECEEIYDIVEGEENVDRRMDHMFESSKQI